MSELIRSLIDLVQVIPGLSEGQREHYKEQYKRILAGLSDGLIDPREDVRGYSIEDLYVPNNEQ